jgi:hypothetical protein
MNELKKIIESIESTLERNQDQSYAYQSGAYEQALRNIKQDLEFYIKHNEPEAELERDHDPFGVLEALNAIKIR